ncbi:hypothetical protein ANO14919_114960 [Xylariales sp. No.14919]|nr:hypothetical protein ANO14919_114960 [Xylariales sp. No.14919]
MNGGGGRKDDAISIDVMCSAWSELRDNASHH